MRAIRNIRDNAGRLLSPPRPHLHNPRPPLRRRARHAVHGNREPEDDEGDAERPHSGARRGHICATALPSAMCPGFAAYWCILVAAGVAVVVSFAMAWFNPIVKVSDISRIRGR
jgi:hypothetical protein